VAVDRAQRKEWAKEHFRGAENIIQPSFSPDLAELDEEGIRLDVRQSVKHGAFSTFCAIESGLTIPEKKRFLEIAVDEAGDDIHVGFPLAGDSLGENIELLEHAEKAGCSHALVSYPHSFEPRDEDEIHDFIRAMCEATSVGVVLFTNDKFGFHRLHGSGVPTAAFDRLVEVDNVVAMKVSTMDLGVVSACFDRYGDRVLVSVPTIIQMPFVMAHYDMQWTGAWTIEAFQTPEQRLIIDLMDLLEAGRLDEAMGLFGRMGPLLGAMGPRLAAMLPSGTYHWTLFKYLQWLSGGNGGGMRQPCMKLTQRDMDDIRGAFAACGLNPLPDSDDEFMAGRSARQEAVA
jgi:4-hydroxy-tetrahydrodipicolinate synthase